MSKLKSYHFNLGNSTKGPIGMCAQVKATSKKEAVEILQRVLPEELEIKHQVEDTDEIEYVNVYFGSENITIEDIDDVEDEEDEADGKAKEAALPG